MSDISSVFHALIERIAIIPDVQSIGRSGGRALPASPADGDIDVFIYCGAIPQEEARRAALNAMGAALADVKIGAFAGGRWGTGDFAAIGGIETWLMYMTTPEATAEVDSILAGRELDKQNYYFYPTGRLGMLLGMEILCDKTGYLQAIKERLAVYPEELSKKLTEYHLGKLADTEDIERAVARRDVLFYHFALDLALDHFLQTLFAMNRVYFPSRKRSLEYIAKFQIKPENCEARLLEAVRLGGMAEEMGQSYLRFKELVGGIQALVP